MLKHPRPLKSSTRRERRRLKRAVFARDLWREPAYIHLDHRHKIWVGAISKPSAARRRNRLGMRRILITLALPSIVAISIALVGSSGSAPIALSTRATLPSVNAQIRASPSPSRLTKFGCGVWGSSCRDSSCGQWAHVNGSQEPDCAELRVLISLSLFRA